MSTQNRSGGGGPKAKKGGNPVASGGSDGNTNKKTEHAKTEKEKPHAKPTAEQIRIAQITDIKGGREDPSLKEKVASLIETTQRSEEDVCYALYECDEDLDRAVIFLLETLTEDAFEKTSKKKSKNRTLSTNNNNDGQDGEWPEANTTPSARGGGGDGKERSRSRGMRGGRTGSDSRSWRGREARENERNAADTKGGDGWRPGRGGRNGSGGGRGGYSGSRGGRVGRMGRGTGSRDQGRGFSRQPDNLETVDSWDNSQANTTEVKADDTWGDWDNEEYTGSLADSKVFTPSAATQATASAGELAAPPGLEQQILSPPTAEELVAGVQQFSAGAVVSSTTTAAVVAGTAAINNNSVQYPELGTAAQIRQALDMPQINSSTLSAEQSQYFNSLSSQNSSQTANVNSYQPASVQYPAAYGANSSFGDAVSSQPTVRKTRARVPPPSKIPSSAVEMPGDTLNNIGYLDVQFGGLDFGTEDNFDTLADKFNTTSLDTSVSVANPGDVTADYQSKNSQQSLAAGLQTSQMQRTANSVSQSSGPVNNSVNVINSAGSGASGYQVPYTNNTPAKASYQATGTGQGGYSNTNYASTQVSSTNNYPPSSNSYNSYNQNSVSSYQSANSTNVAAVNNSNNASNSSSTTSIPVGGSAGVGNSGSATGNTGYLSSQYPVSQSSSVFPSQPSAYQNSPSVYGNSSGRYTGSTNTSTAQYSNFTSTKLKENAATTISTPFESATSSAVSSSAPSAVSNSAVTTSSMSSPSLGLTKVTSATTKGSGGVMPNIPMVSQYIQTASVPFYPPSMYAYEDIQMMQQRMPHLQAENYNLYYQTPTSLGAGVRDANLGSVAAYSTMSDGRFTRTDNNSSPVSNVPSTMSQQTGPGGQMMNVPYGYFYGGMPAGSFQYGMYPQQMATVSATSGGQFPKPSYNSGYGSTTYDALTTTQDYSKSAYPGSGVGQQSKGQNVNNPPPSGTGSDISSSMYSKTHVALNKVNSYDKQSFHSGTPPPFNLAGTQTAGATSAQPYGMYIPAIPPPHHNINMHQQPIHQDSNSSGQRPQSSSQGKTYWTAQN